MSAARDLAETIQLGKPQQSARHERIPKTLKAEIKTANCWRRVREFRMIDRAYCLGLSTPEELVALN